MIGVGLLSFLVGFSGALIPGPLFAVALGQALQGGWTVGLWLTVGHMMSEAVLIGTLYAGLGRQLQRPMVTRIIGVVGGAVLLYLSVGMLQTAHDLTEHPTAVNAPALSVLSLILTGVLLTVTNPTWYIWWGTAGVGLIGGQLRRHGARAWPAFFVGHTLADYLWYIAVTAAAGLGGALLSTRLHQGLIVACALGVVVLGLLFLIRPVVEWWRERAVPTAGT